jgi:aminoglycoside phosphotransferase (APT) family kinase protein
MLPTRMSHDVAELRTRLEAFLTEKAGAAAHVTAARPLAGGASREMFAIDVTVDDGPDAGSHRLVLRRDLGGRIYDQSLERDEEYRVIEAANAAGVKVPRVRWLCTDPRVLGTPFFFQDRLEGETIGRRIVKASELTEARAKLPEQMGRELAKIHAIDARSLAFLPGPRPGQTAAEHYLEHVTASLDAAEDPHPALELALRWLAQNIPHRSARTLVHGDYRIGNVMVGPEGLRGVLDWEFARIGDPLEDVAWPLVRAWRFGADALEMGGVGERAPYLAAYAEASGRSIDPSHVDYWEIMGNLQWAIGCIAQARRHLSGQARSVELASLGRKTAEMELDLLDLLQAKVQGGR